VLKLNVEPCRPIIGASCEYSPQEGGGTSFVMVERGVKGLRGLEPRIRKGGAVGL
jgi:hypothetical protein